MQHFDRFGVALDAAERPRQQIRRLEETVARVMPLIPKERILVVTGKNLAKPIASKCPQLLTENIIVEPLGRNTAPAIGLAAIMLQAQDPQALMAVLSADHQISPQEEFL